MGDPQRPRGIDATGSKNRWRDMGLQSEPCCRCVDGCIGNCEMFKAAFRGPELICPKPVDVTADGTRGYLVDYSHLNIHGYDLGGAGVPEDVLANPDAHRLPVVNTETSYGWDRKVKMAAPVFTGTAGSTEFARKNWEHLAVGAALAGITCVCGENVCGIDPRLQRDRDGKVTWSPDMDRRITTYKRYHRGDGEILVQVNVEDSRLGVAEYVIDRHGLDTIELKWGQGVKDVSPNQHLPWSDHERDADRCGIGSKCIGGPGKVGSLERALELQSRGYIVTPDPSNPVIRSACEDGTIREFECHSRLGFVEEDAFCAECDRLRGLGFKRITLKTAAHGLRELAMLLKWGSKARIDLVTIDSVSGGTGMSPLPAVQEWGVPAIYLHSAAAEFAARLAAKGQRVPDLAFAGPFSTESQIFKCLALGAPFVKAVCMGRAMMIPAVVGKNIAEWLKVGNLPKTVSEFGSTPEEIFVCWEQIADLVGRNEMPKIPLGAVGIYSYVNKLQVGLQQLMAGARCFNLGAISRRDLMSLTRECADVTGIPYVMDLHRQEAEAILDS